MVFGADLSTMLNVSQLVTVISIQFLRLLSPAASMQGGGYSDAQFRMYGQT